MNWRLIRYRSSSKFELVLSHTITIDMKLDFKFQYLDLDHFNLDMISRLIELLCHTSFAMFYGTCYVKAVFNVDPAFETSVSWKHYTCTSATQFSNIIREPLAKKLSWSLQITQLEKKLSSQKTTSSIQSSQDILNDFPTR